MVNKNNMVLASSWTKRPTEKEVRTRAIHKWKYEYMIKVALKINGEWRDCSVEL